MAMLQNHVINFRSLSPGAPLTPVKRRACDRCRQRKSKCDGGDTCALCFKAAVPCSYLTASKKRGPRRRVLGERKQPLRPAPSTLTREAPQQPGPQDPQQMCGEDLVPEFQQLNPPYEALSAGSTYFSDILAFGEATVDNNTLFEDPLYPLVPDILKDAPPNVTDRRVSRGTPSSLLPSAAVSSTENNLARHTTPIPTSAPRANDTSTSTLPRPALGPYVELFFLRLYPIFPVLDKESLRSKCQSPIEAEESMTLSEYALLTALSALVIVQLNVHDTPSLVQALSSYKPGTGPETPLNNIDIKSYSAGYFVTECLAAREKGGFIECPDENTIMSSFFLFGYFGNIDRPKSAWYYLREAIGFALLLGLDDEDSYSQGNGVVSQRKRRIFWLLFVTERYALGLIFNLLERSF
jgi:hypothetical protein